jgi:hypothetical protein
MASTGRRMPSGFFLAAAAALPVIRRTPPLERNAPRFLRRRARKAQVDRVDRGEQRMLRRIDGDSSIAAGTPSFRHRSYSVGGACEGGAKWRTKSPQVREVRGGAAT